MRRVVTLGAAALAFALALCTPAHAQQVETRVFDYEWLVIRLPQFMTNFEFGVSSSYRRSPLRAAPTAGSLRVASP